MGAGSPRKGGKDIWGVNTVREIAEVARGVAEDLRERGRDCVTPQEAEVLTRAVFTNNTGYLRPRVRPAPGAPAEVGAMLAAVRYHRAMAVDLREAVALRRELGVGRFREVDHLARALVRAIGGRPYGLAIWRREVYGE